VSVELHLPDLPEVAVSVGPPPGTAPLRAQRGRSAWRLWLRDLFGASLPLLLMALLALGTWWLVKHAPSAPQARPTSAPTHDPDYRLENFQAERFDAAGNLAVTLRGQRLRHYPDTDELNIDVLNLQATGVDGRRLSAVAQQAWVSQQAQSVRLEGQAHVTSSAKGTQPIDIISEHLLVQTHSHDVRADKPVQVTQGHNRFQADSLEFDGQTRVLTLHGPARAVFLPQAALGHGATAP